MAAQQTLKRRDKKKVDSNIGYPFLYNNSFKEIPFDIDFFSHNLPTKIIQQLKTALKNELIKILADIKLPKRFTVEAIANEILKKNKFDLHFQKNFNNQKKIYAPKEKEQELFKYLMFVIWLISKVGVTIQKKEEIARLIPLFEALKSIIKETLEDFLETLKKEQRRIDRRFLNSDFPAAYARIINDTLNISRTYTQYFLTSLPTFEQFLSEAFWAKESYPDNFKEEYAFFTLLPVFQFYQTKILYNYLKIELHINIWHSKNLKEILIPKDKLSIKNLDEKFFLEQLNSLAETSTEFHKFLCKVALLEKKPLPFTLNKGEISTENLKFLSQILTNNNFD